MVNVYLPPGLSTAAEQTAWEQVLDHLDSLCATDPIVLVGDLNMHMGHIDGLIGSACALHGDCCARVALQGCAGGTAGLRGERVYSSL